MTFHSKPAKGHFKVKGLLSWQKLPVRSSIPIRVASYSDPPRCSPQASTSQQQHNKKTAVRTTSRADNRIEGATDFLRTSQAQPHRLNRTGLGICHQGLDSTPIDFSVPYRQHQMMNRPGDGMDPAAFNQAGFPRARAQRSFLPGQHQTGGNEELLQRFAMQNMNQQGLQAPMTPGGRQQFDQMGGSAMGYRQDIAGDSPAMGGNMPADYMGHDLSPGVAQRMQQQMNAGMYQQMGNPSPNFAGAGPMGDMEGRAMAQGGPGGPQSQADREEELLLNLLIARRQRGGQGKGRNPQQSLAEELMRLRQGRAASAGQLGAAGGRTAIPPMPGMPPFFESAAPMQGGPMNPGMSIPQNEYFASKPDMMQFQAGAMMHDVGDRIHRSPTRLIDARSQEMLDYSGRGIKRAMGHFDAKFPDLAGMDIPSPKKKRTHKKKPADMPRRPLSAYNLFFSEERERILKEIDEKEGGGVKKEESTDVEGADDSKEDSSESKPKALLRPMIPSQKKRRPHRKTHGKISFQQLARMVGERWKSLDDERREYYKELAREDMRRQKIAMEEYYAKQNPDASKDPSDDKDDDMDTEDNDTAKVEEEPRIAGYA